jgi:hypothetical protein
MLMLPSIERCRVMAVMFSRRCGDFAKIASRAEPKLS